MSSESKDSKDLPLVNGYVVEDNISNVEYSPKTESSTLAKTVTMDTETNGYQAGSPDSGDSNDKVGDSGKSSTDGLRLSYDQVLCDIHESAMQIVGFGRLQWVLYMILGLAQMGDGVELLMVAYILSGAEQDFCMTAPMKGWLGATAFAGMLFGAPLWGNLADHIGRKPTLLSSLGVNVCFAILGSFMPSFWPFLICRFISGLGIGGSIPIVLSYAGEFSTKANRGFRLGLLMVFWVSGGLYVSLMGWIIIPTTGFSYGSSFHFQSWRVFILVCCIPAVLAILGVLLMPESPRYLIQVGKDMQALKVYRKIYAWNHRNRTEFEADYEMLDLDIPQRSTICVHNEEVKQANILCKSIEKCQEFIKTFCQLFHKPTRRLTCILLVLWFAISFGAYGMSIWFPEYMKRLQQEEYFKETNLRHNELIYNITYTQVMDNVHFYNSTLEQVTFLNIDLVHVVFEHCHLVNCSFINVTAKQSYFKDATIENTHFTNTNFYSNKFHNSSLDKSTQSSFTGLTDGCQVDFEVSYNGNRVLLETLIGQMAVVPVLILNSLLLDKFGRVKPLIVCMMLSTISVLFIWLTDTEPAVVVLNAVLNCVIGGSFNSLEISTTELYPTQMRATAFGVHTCIARIAAIIGNMTFGNFIDVSKTIPILTTALVLFIGGIVGCKLPESSNIEM